MFLNKNIDSNESEIPEERLHGLHNCTMSCSDVRPFRAGLNYGMLNPETWYLNPVVRNRAESSNLNPESCGKKQS